MVPATRERTCITRAVPPAAWRAHALLLSLVLALPGTPAGAVPPQDEDPWYGDADDGEYYSVDERLAQFRERATRRLAPYFLAAGVDYPPASVVLLGLKEERRLELYAASPGGELRFIRYYPVIGASGTSGPKLEEGDRQVPEGLYTLSALNPNSRFHVSLKVDYPNRFDRLMARVEGRSNPGSNIFIHGGSDSAGCLAMSDGVAEQLFMLAADTGLGNISVILSPRDLRTARAPEPHEDDVPTWSPHLYAIIERAMRPLPAPASHWAHMSHRLE
ncbi:MAG: L,D-transpeptidase family protein [Gammaproteobacteria bacterium]|nr:L,D-transpeptidase family protein [Gammaproteobacteria bacterium]